MQARDLLFSNPQKYIDVLSINHDEPPDHDMRTPLIDRTLYQSPRDRAVADIVYSRRLYADVMNELSDDEQASVWIELLENPFVYKPNNCFTTFKGLASWSSFIVFAGMLGCLIYLTNRKPGIHSYLMHYRHDTMAGVNATCGTAFNMNKIVSGDSLRNKFINQLNNTMPYGNMTIPFLQFCSDAMNNYYNKYGIASDDIADASLFYWILGAIPLVCLMVCSVRFLISFNYAIFNDTHLWGNAMRQNNLRYEHQEKLSGWLRENNLYCHERQTISAVLDSINVYQAFLNSPAYLMSSEYKKKCIIHDQKKSQSYFAKLPLDLLKIVLAYSDLIQVMHPTKSDEDAKPIEFYNLNIKSKPDTISAAAASPSLR